MQLDGLRIVATGKPTQAPIEVACEQSKMVFSFPNTACNAASIFSAGYKLSARNAFKIAYILDRKRIRGRIGIRDRIGDRIVDKMGIETCRGLKARSANFVNASVDSSIDEPLRNMSMIIKPPRHISMESSKILTG
jgi:hypothetical protein